MRLEILDRGHTFARKVLLGFIAKVSGLPPQDVIKLGLYRPEFFGGPMGEILQAAMRGPSEWSIAEREMMASYVSKANDCEFLTKAHAAVAALSWQSDAKVEAVLADLDTAPIDDKLRATLRLLRKLTREHAVTADDMRTVLAAGVTKSQIEDALAVCFCFNVISRLADAFEFEVGPRAVFEAAARHLVKRGYR